MDLAKFMSLLETGGIYFARADTLGDPFEGSVPLPNVEFYEQVTKDDTLREKTFPSMTADVILNMRRQIAEHRRQTARNMFVSCWHASNYESAAMWSIYSKIDESISIKTSYSSLADALPPICHMGMVTYIDYTNGFIPEDNLFNPFMTKRHSFEYEREARAVIWANETSVRQQKDQGSGDILYSDSGITVILDIKELIDEIYISPTAPSWFSELITSIAERYGLEIPITHSSLSAAPVY